MYYRYAGSSCCRKLAGSTTCWDQWEEVVWLFKQRKQQHFWCRKMNKSKSIMLLVSFLCFLCLSSSHECDCVFELHAMLTIVVIALGLVSNCDEYCPTSVFGTKTKLTQNIQMACDTSGTIRYSSHGRLLGGMTGNERVLLMAAKSGDAKTVRRELALGTNINCQDENGATPLVLAMFGGHQEVVKLLLPGHDGLDVKVVPAGGGALPLHTAATRGDIEWVMLLLAAPRVDVNAVDSYGYTPLHLAASFGYIEVVRLLLAARGVDVHAREEAGCTPLLLAAEHGRVGAVRLLLAVKGIDVNTTNYKGIAPLTLAASNGHTEVARLLLAAEGVDVNIMDKFVLNPLLVATIQGHYEVVKLLLAVPGIDINVTDSDGSTPLMVSRCNEFPRIERLILKAASKAVVPSPRPCQAPRPVVVHAPTAGSFIKQLREWEEGGVVRLSPSGTSAWTQTRMVRWVIKKKVCGGKCGSRAKEGSRTGVIDLRVMSSTSFIGVT